MKCGAIVTLPQPSAMIGNAARYEKLGDFLSLRFDAANNPLFAARV